MAWRFIQNSGLEKRAKRRAVYRAQSRVGRYRKELRISAAELARQIDLPVNRITGSINGQYGLATWFGTSAEFWLNLQKRYELRLAREEVGSLWKNIFDRRYPAYRSILNSPIDLATSHYEKSQHH
jgi:plasmid maintenance system antidote protein VapI